ncbi:glycosyltransferase family 4 protein [Pseudaquidulcibacter saccharophilus]|uniref:glycosyltransferase family 4 protein n=1 Tax=Pseudaquidulcibacter saccharophilus TaxID=2831900 RepID=UPI001EFEF929|nr:glycosyltransferase [Pseudaquidulcibacter saccharophilus]
MKIFETIRVREGIKIGNLVFTLNLKSYFDAFIYLTERVLQKLKIIKEGFTEPAPYSVSYPLSQNDIKFVDDIIAGDADILIADYCYLTKAFPKPSGGFNPRKYVVMHDFISQRFDDFKASGTKEKTSFLTFEDEMALLSNADIVIAIQKEEADKIKNGLHAGTDVVVCPIAADIYDKFNAKDANNVLFLGSGAAPNVDGILWFISEVWPKIIEKNPNARLKIAGSVCSKINVDNPTIELMGIVDDLVGFYQSGNIVISPLRLGSGLKVKLIEAAGHAKAVVATTITLQGVYDEFKDALVIADEANDFANAIINLLDDNKKREILSENILNVAKQYFSNEAVNRPLLEDLSLHIK